MLGTEKESKNFFDAPEHDDHRSRKILSRGLQSKTNTKQICKMILVTERLFTSNSH
jgi:hypothetical protein